MPTRVGKQRNCDGCGEHKSPLKQVTKKLWLCGPCRRARRYPKLDVKVSPDAG